MHDHIPNKIKNIYKTATCLYSKVEIEAALDRMAQEMDAKLAEKNPLLLCVMVGALIPAGNLLLRLDFPLEVDYIHATRYRGATTGGEISWLVEPTLSLQGRAVVIIDDILDEGLTLAAVAEYCRTKGASEIYTSVLLDKQQGRVVGGIQRADFTGITMETGYVFGYGMDYKGYLRNVPGIYVVAPEYQ